MKIINTTNGKTVCEIRTNHSITIEEALTLAGAEKITEDHLAYNENECGDYYLNGEEIWVEELDFVEA